MAKLRVHLYGLIPGSFKDVEIETVGRISLEELERQIVSLYGEEIHKDFITYEGLLDHSLIVCGDKHGNRIDYACKDVGFLEEIWFVVLLSGG